MRAKHVLLLLVEKGSLFRHWAIILLIYWTYGGCLMKTEMVEGMGDNV